MRRAERMRPSSIYYERFDGLARQLTVAALRASADVVAVQAVEAWLREARCPGANRHLLRWLDRVWTRAELGVLITEATNRARQLAAGDPQRPKGPRLDPARLPDDRLDFLIQHHRDMATVEALRAERRRRQHSTNQDAS